MTASPASRSGRRKWLRRGTQFLGVSLALGVLICLALVVSLRLSAVREAILGWAGSAIEESTGIHMTARDFALSLRTGGISLYDLVLRADGRESEPFFVVPAAEAELSWRSLLSDRPQIYSLRIHEPAFDLGASLPQGPGEDRAASEDLFPPLDIHRFELIDGSISSGEAPNELDVWWDRWQADQMKLGGSLLAGVADLEIQETRIAIDSHRRPKISADLTAQFTVDDVGLLAIQNLVLDGDDLSVTLDGHGRLDSDAPFEATFEVRTDLAELLPDLTAGGQPEASGMVTFTAAPEAILTGNVQVSGQDFPAELLDPLLAGSNLENLRLDGTHLDLTADLETRIAFAELASEPPNDLVS